MKQQSIIFGAWKPVMKDGVMCLKNAGDPPTYVPIKPLRIQLSRKRGFNLQEVSKKLNGLPAVNCARPSRWGNPERRTAGVTNHYLVACFRDYVRENLDFVKLAKQELSGKNLACFCKLEEECHCDVLLELLK